MAFAGTVPLLARSTPRSLAGFPPARHRRNIRSTPRCRQRDDYSAAGRAAASTMLCHHGTLTGSQVVVRREPSRVAFISETKHFPCGTPHVSIQRKVDMRAHRIFLSFAIAMGCGITLQSTAFSQEYRGTWEQQRACTPDVWRLCGAQIPDVDRIVACLRRNTPQLSDRCRAVFEQGDNAPTRREDRDYGQKRYDRDYGPRRYGRDYGPRRYDREYGPRPYDYDDE